MKGNTCAVKLMAILELLSRLAGAHLSKVCFQIHTGTNNTTNPGTPHRNFHFVVRVVRAGIKDLDLSGLAFGRHIAVPQVQRSFSLSVHGLLR